MEQKKESKSKFCAAAKRYPTKGKAFEAFNNDEGKHGVFLIEEVVNGTIKYIPYGRCCNSVQDNELCHIHENQRKKEKSGFLYFEKDIKNKCDNQKIKKATANMPFFKQMGDRGRNKASKTTYHDFKNEDDPILKIIKLDKNPKLLKSLKIYAIQLLNEQNIIVKSEKEEQPKEENETISKNKELLETIERLNIEHEKKIKLNEESNIKSNKNEISEIDENSSDIDENSDIDQISDIDEVKEINECSDIDEINEIDDINQNSDSEDSYEVDEIYTNKGKLLYLVPNSMSIIEPEGDNESGECIGTMFKIDKKYHTIKKDESYYTVFSENKVIYDEVEYFRDVINNRIFDDNFNFKGRVSLKTNSTEYKFHFD